MHSSQLQLACKALSTHQLYYSPAVCTPLLHHCCPNCYHTLCPTPPCSRTLHGHSLVIYHQPVELFHQRILKTHKNRTVLQSVTWCVYLARNRAFQHFLHTMCTTINYSYLLRASILPENISHLTRSQECNIIPTKHVNY